MNSIAESVMGTKSTTDKQPVRAPRAGRRAAQQLDARNAKRATRKHRRDAIDGLQNQQTALGIARVYLGGAGNPAMQANVVKHVRGLAEALSTQEDIGWLDAHDRIVARLQEVLDAHDAV